MRRSLATTSALMLAAAGALAGCSTNRIQDAAHTMTVVGTEMSFDALDEVASGTYEVTFRNIGAEHHELAFVNPAGEFVARRSIPGGESVVMEVDLTPGDWELGCFEPGHYEAGMHKPLVVVEPSAGS